MKVTPLCAERGATFPDCHLLIKKNYTASNLQQNQITQSVTFTSDQELEAVTALRSAEVIECITMCAILDFICPRLGSGRTLLCRLPITLVNSAEMTGTSFLAHVGEGDIRELSCNYA